MIQLTVKGPHIYVLYKYEKDLPERTVAALYASGFIAAAVSASFVGQLADRYGRRAGCLVYCVSYSICCLSMISSSMIILLVGRMCGGLSTTLLYSVFETWMITEYHQRDLEAAGLTLSNIFGMMTIISSMVAICSGVLGDGLVAMTQSRVSPFLASVASLVAAFAYISKYWVSRWYFWVFSHYKLNSGGQTENYGDSGTESLGVALSPGMGVKALIEGEIKCTYSGMGD